jgi:hypothetical protein
VLWSTCFHLLFKLPPLNFIIHMRDIYCYMQVVLSMKISTILLFICNIVCLNCCLINCDLNNLLKQFACWDFHKLHTLYFHPSGIWAWRPWVWDGIRVTCALYYLILVKHMCCNNINNYFWSLIYLIGLIFMLSVASACSTL